MKRQISVMTITSELTRHSTSVTPERGSTILQRHICRGEALLVMLVGSAILIQREVFRETVTPDEIGANKRGGHRNR